ncbi:MAG: mannitol dehydrogenase family protein [Pseudomonadota bacterium]
MKTPALFRTSYDQSACEIGWIHIGYGAFHRAHQAVYLDDYMERTGDLRWGIAAINLRDAQSASFAEASEMAQGYVLKSIAPDHTLSYRAVRPHVAFVDAAQALAQALELFERPSVSVASMTVTESGYAFRSDWSLNLDAPEISADLSSPATPHTIYGFFARALERRMQSGSGPLTILCCDNIRSNGHVVENAMLSFVEAAGKPELAAWIRANVTFPCSMVDRITPRVTTSLNDEISTLFPEHATSPVHAEDYTQWVLEDRFAGPMPDLTKAGVEVVADVAPYEEAKIRILNGGHTGLAYLGALAGHQTFDQAMQDQSLRAHFEAWERDEVLHGLGDAIPFDTALYLNAVAARFENAGIGDQLERICMDGYSKMPIYIRPTLAACLARGIVPKAGFDCIASWIVFARRAAAGQSATPYHEPFAATLAPLLAHGAEEALASDETLWGDLPKTYATFVPGITAAIQRMDEQWQV